MDGRDKAKLITLERKRNGRAVRSLTLPSRVESLKSEQETLSLRASIIFATKVQQDGFLFSSTAAATAIHKFITACKSSEMLDHHLCLSHTAHSQSKLEGPWRPTATRGPNHSLHAASDMAT